MNSSNEDERKSPGEDGSDVMHATTLHTRLREQHARVSVAHATHEAAIKAAKETQVEEAQRTRTSAQEAQRTRTSALEAFNRAKERAAHTFQSSTTEERTDTHFAAFVHAVKNATATAANTRGTDGHPVPIPARRALMDAAFKEFMNLTPTIDAATGWITWGLAPREAGAHPAAIHSPLSLRLVVDDPQVTVVPRARGGSKIALVLKAAATRFERPVAYHWEIMAPAMQGCTQTFSRRLFMEVKYDSGTDVFWTRRITEPFLVERRGVDTALTLSYSAGSKAEEIQWSMQVNMRDVGRFVFAMMRPTTTGDSTPGYKSLEDAVHAATTPLEPVAEEVSCRKTRRPCRCRKSRDHFNKLRGGDADREPLFVTLGDVRLLIEFEVIEPVGAA